MIKHFYASILENPVLNAICFMPLFLLISFRSISQNGSRRYLRGDQHVSFKWRYGYSEFPFPPKTVSAQEDALRGRFAMYDGTLWSQAYKGVDDSIIHGVQLLFRGGSPYAREVICTSETVPLSYAGTPVSFLIPFQYSIGSEDDIAFSLRVKGSGEETIVCKLRPQEMNSFTGGMFKISFISYKVAVPTGIKPIVTVAGIMHLRVYPPLIKYGSSIAFIVSSVTHHMDVESSLVLGSLYRDITKSDPYKIFKRPMSAADTFATAENKHAELLRKWRQSTASRAISLMQQGRVEVDCDGPEKMRDRGELRVMAYSGNPVKDFQYGEPTHQAEAMAAAVTGALGRRFSLFRYQHHYLPWKQENPSLLDNGQIKYLKQWLTVADSYADTVMLDLQLSPIIKLYKEYTQMGRFPLPANGIPGAEWKKIQQGYLTTLRFAKTVCPALRIIQMPYELDNISTSEIHGDANYRFFQCLYEAVASFNHNRPVNQQLKIAGLGSNNPNSRWNFIEGFLKRYSADTAKNKRLDYLTWHTYLFPGNYPAMVKGISDSLKRLLKLNGLDDRLPVIVDEMGLAEPSAIEDLSDLQGAMKKEAAMASFTMALQEYYEKEHGNFIPVSGAGWHFALLTYGRQNILSAYARGMVLRNKLGNRKIPAHATPVDPEGYGLHAVATRSGDKIIILLYCASPSIFFENAKPLNYQNIEVVLKDIPLKFKDAKLKVTEWLSSPEDPDVKQILLQNKYQTLPLTRGADRYNKDFTPVETRILNKLKMESRVVIAGENNVMLSASLGAYDMRLIEIETAGDKE